MPFERVTLKNTLNIKGIYSVHYFEFSKNYTFVGESHDFWEMVYADKGKIIATAGNREFELASGEVLFHQPNEWHNLRSDGEIAPNMMVITFACDSKAMDFFKEKCFKIDGVQKGMLRELLKESRNAFCSDLSDPYNNTLIKRKDSPVGSEQLVSLLLTRFLISLLRHEQEASRTDRKIGTVPLLDSILEYMENNLSEKLSLDSLSEEFHVSVSHIKRMFAQYKQQGAMKTFAQMKIDKAKQLLRESDLNVSEISVFLGYDSVYYFCNQFKQYTNMSPLEYRKSVK